eukprot:7378568-Prymnesium_polylepis.2
MRRDSQGGQMDSVGDASGHPEGSVESRQPHAFQPRCAKLGRACQIRASLTLLGLRLLRRLLDQRVPLLHRLLARPPLRRRRALALRLRRLLSECLRLLCSRTGYAGTASGAYEHPALASASPLWAHSHARPLREPPARAIADSAHRPHRLASHSLRALQFDEGLTSMKAHTPHLALLARSLEHVRDRGVLRAHQPPHRRLLVRRRRRERALALGLLLL